MNEDYLWDKSGEPDPEMERLENTLASLRYKRPAEPLPLPATPTQRRWSFRLNFSPALAAAAALLILLLAGGLWLGLRRSPSTEDKNAVATGTAPEEKQIERPDSGPRPPLGSPDEDKVAKATNTPAPAPPSPAVNRPPRRYTNARQMTARRREPSVSPAPRTEQLAREGEQAKAQLIMALHIASDKLNTVQKKMQANPGT